MGVGRVSLLRTWYSFLIRAEQELRKVDSPEAKQLVAEIASAKYDISQLMVCNGDPAN